MAPHFVSLLLLSLTTWTTAFSVGRPHQRTLPSPHTVLAAAATSTNDAALAAETTATTDTTQTLADTVKSVNYFISRKCNYSCQFCFHTQKTSHALTLAQASIGLRLLQQAGTRKLNFAGGEPFLHPELLGDLCRVASADLGLAVSIISNGSLITEEWMETYGRYVDVLGVSVDSFVDATNVAIGRGEKTATTNKRPINRHVDRVLRVRELCYEHDIMFKLNTVVCSLNWDEDMSEPVRLLNPHRWKVFQVLLLEDENVGAASLRDARPLVVSDDQFADFCERHRSAVHEGVLIAEPNSVMQNSYLLLDEDMRFLDCSEGGKVPGESILKVGVETALSQAGFDHGMFQQRGGEYDWKREKPQP